MIIIKCLLLFNYNLKLYKKYIKIENSGDSSSLKKDFRKKYKCYKTFELLLQK